MARSTLFDQLQKDVYQGDFFMQGHQLGVPYGYQGQLIYPSWQGSKSIDISLRYSYLPRTVEDQAIGTCLGTRQ